MDSNNALSELEPLGRPSPRTPAMNMNRRIMAELQSAMQDDPELDLLSAIPKSYQKMLADFKQKAGSATLSDAARLNLDTIDELQDMVNEDPEVDLLSRFPKNYTTIKEGRGHRFKKKKFPGKIKKPEPVLTHFNHVVSATVVLPLSDAVTTLLATHTKSIPDSMNAGESLAHSLKLLFEQSEKLWEFQTRGAVFKCSDEIVAKVSLGKPTPESMLRWHISPNTHQTYLPHARMD